MSSKLINGSFASGAILAQLVERIFRKDEAPGSIPGDGSRIDFNLVCL